LSKEEEMANLAHKNEDAKLHKAKSTLQDGTRATKMKVEGTTCYDGGCGRHIWHCGKEGRRKVKAPNFQIDMRNPFFVAITENR